MRWPSLPSRDVLLCGVFTGVRSIVDRLAAIGRARGGIMDGNRADLQAWLRAVEWLREGERLAKQQIEDARRESGRRK